MPSPLVANVKNDVMRQRDFALLWRSDAISQVSGQVCIYALPAVAILALHVAPAQLGALQAMEFAIPAVFAILIGVFVDRVRRKPLLIVANTLRFAAIALLVLAFSLHRVEIAHLFACGAVIAFANVLFDTAYAAFVPALLGRERFGRANATLTMTASAAEALGSSASGAVISFLGAPVALAFNAFAYCWSTIALLRLRTPEPPRAPRERSAPGRVHRFTSEFYDGVAFVFATGPLRAIAVTSATAYFGGSMVMAVFTLYALRTLHMSPLLFGAIMGFGNAGLFGGMFARRLLRHLGPRLTLALATALSGAGKLLFLFAPAPILALLAGRLIVSFTGPIFNIVDQEVRVRCASDAQLGRMNATMRTIIWSALPLGALGGGLLAEYVGIQTTIAAGGCIGLFASGIMLASPSFRRSQRVTESVQPYRQPVSA